MLDEGGKGVVGSAGSVILQELLVGGVHLYLLTPDEGKKGQERCRGRGTGIRRQREGTKPPSRHFTVGTSRTGLRKRAGAEPRRW